MTYTQTNRSVGSSQLNLFTSNIPFGEEWIAFADDTYYYCVYGNLNINNSNQVSFTDSTVMKVVRSYTSSQELIISEEASTTVNVPFPINVSSNIGIGVLTSTRVEEYNYNQVVTFGTGVLFTLLLVTIGLSIIRKRWLV